MPSTNQRWQGAPPLEEDASLLTSVLEVNGIGVFEYDIPGDSYRFSLACKALWGMPPDEQPTRARLWELMHPDDLHVHQSAMRAPNPGGTGHFTFEHRVMLPEGRVRWLRVRGDTEFEDTAAGRRAVRAVGVMIDVTDRRRAEEQLRTKEQHLSVALRTAHAGAWAWDVRSNDLLWSPELYVLYGMDPDGPPITLPRWMEAVHQDDRPAMSRFADELRASPHDCQVEFRVITPAGVRWLLSIGQLERDSQGNALRFVGLNFDITERTHAEAAVRASEYRFRVMADGVPAIIWVTDPEGRIEFVNREYCAFFDVTLEQVQQAGWRPQVHPDDEAAAIAEWVAARALRTPLRVRHRIRHGSGGWRSMETHAVPRFGDDNRYLGHVGVSTDITQTVAFQQALRDADRRKDEFLATLAHELRNPLAPIRNAAHLLARTGLSAERLAWAQNVIQRQVKHMARLLDDLLDIARITQAKLELKLERVALAAVIDAAIEAARPLIDSKQHRLTLMLPEGPVDLEGDPVRLSQVVSNLLTNAAKYTDPGGLIQIEASVQDAIWSLTVRDNGIGIPADMLGRVFDMFSQVDDRSDRTEGGLGIGLSLVRGLVELHGGTIHATSAGPGHGSTFSVRLPLVSRAPTRPRAG